MYRNSVNKKNKMEKVSVLQEIPEPDEFRHEIFKAEPVEKSVENVNKLVYRIEFSTVTEIARCISTAKEQHLGLKWFYKTNLCKFSCFHDQLGVT